MALTSPITRRFRDFYDPFDEIFQSLSTFPAASTALRSALPAPSLTTASHMDIIDKHDHFQVNIEMPGVRKEDIHVELDGNRLFVNATKTEERREEGERTYWSERVYGSVRRTVELPGSVDPNKLLAKYENGVLRVMVGKREEGTQKQMVVVQ